MTDDRTATGQGAGPWLAWALLGVVAGTACQLQQAALWSGVGYAALAGGGVVVAGVVARRRRQGPRSWPVLLAAAMLAFALVGLRGKSVV